MGCRVGIQERNQLGDILPGTEDKPLEEQGPDEGSPVVISQAAGGKAALYCPVFVPVLHPYEGGMDQLGRQVDLQNGGHQYWKGQGGAPSALSQIGSRRDA